MRPTNHPFSHFGCGNLTTLATLDQTSIRNWFSQEYDPRGMHLVVYSHEPISVIEDRVKATFGKIASCEDWKGPVRAEQSGPIVPPDATGSWVYIDPVKDIKTVRLVWEIPHQFADWGNRVGSVVGGVLSRIGEGSIFAKLKSESLASSLDAEVENESADSAFLCLEVELTGTGLDNVPRVLEIIFQGIGTLGKLKMPGHIVQQHNALALLDYKWQNRRSDLAFTKQEVVKLRSEEFSAFPKMSLFWEHSPADVAEIFNTHLAPQNCIVYVQAKDLDVTYDKFEPIVGAPYTFTKFSDEEATRFEAAHQSVQDDISYVEKSEFIPQDVRALHAVDPTFANVPRWLPLPTKFDAEEVQTAFVAPDVEFGIPKIDLNTYITSPGLSLGQEAFRRVILHLWLSAVRETTKAMRELASAGGYQ
jgi:insulysin